MAPQISRRRWRWSWGVGGIVIIGVVATVLLRRGVADPKDVDSALVLTVKRADLQIDVLETGKVQPREKVEVKSKVAGQVEKVFVIEGDKVKKGQALLQLDSTDYRREVSRTEAEVAQAQNAVEFAQLNLDRRQRGLEGRGVAQTDVDFAANELKAKTVALKTVQVGLASALDRLRYTQIVAPLDGTVIARGIQPGEVVTPGVQATFEGKALLTVADLSTLIVKADLNQIDVAKIKLGQKASLTLDALPGKTYEAKISQISPASVTPKGKDIEVFPVEATLTVADPAIKPGMTADLRIHIDVRPNVFSLPIEAVVKESGKSYVTRLKTLANGKTQQDKIEIKVGARNDREVEVISGISEGERILIKPGSSAANEYKM